MRGNNKHRGKKNDWGILSFKQIENDELKKIWI